MLACEIVITANIAYASVAESKTESNDSRINSNELYMRTKTVRAVAEKLYMYNLARARQSPL